MKYILLTIAFVCAVSSKICLQLTWKLLLPNENQYQRLSSPQEYLSLPNPFRIFILFSFLQMNLSECAPCLDDLLALEAEAALLDYEFPLNTYGNYRYNRRVDYPPLGDVYNTPGTWSQEEQSWRPSVDPDDRPIRYVSVPVQYNPSPITEIQVGR